MFPKYCPGKAGLAKATATLCMLAVFLSVVPIMAFGEAKAAGYSNNSNKNRAKIVGAIGLAVGVAILSAKAERARAKKKKKRQRKVKTKVRIKVKTKRPRKHVRACPANAYIGRRSGKCSCKKGYNWSGKGRSRRCVAKKKRVASSRENSCPANAYRNKKRRGKCSCKSGFKWAGRGRKAQCRKVKTSPKIVVAKISCRWPEVKSRRGRSCVCARGYGRSARGRGRRSESSSSCRKNRKPRIIPVYVPTPVYEVPKADIARIQRCLRKVGFNPGSTDGRSGRKTVAAFRAFQSKTGLRQSSDLGDKNTRTILFDLCEVPPQRGIVAKAPIVEPVEPKVIETVETVRVVSRSRLIQTSAAYSPAPVQESCLSPDIYKLVRATYGPRPSQSACRNECTTRPRSLTQNQLDTISARTGIKWCTDCVQLNSYLPLREILKIERAANISLCATPSEESLCKTSEVKTITRSVVKTKIRKILRYLPPQADHKGDVAVIIGNENYGSSLPKNVYGLDDALAVRTLLVENLGYEEQNIIHLENATLADLEGVFGDEDGPGGRLSRLLKKNGNGNVFIYASSHGLALSAGEDLLTTGAAGRASAPRKSYLLPVDAKAQNTIETAYPLERFYQNLGELRANSIIVALEAGFSNDLNSRIQAPNIPEFDVDAMPNSQIPGLVVLKASEKDQKTLNDPEFGIGIFTRYLIEGYGGRADDERFGRQDGHVDSIELFAYISQLVRDTARKSFGMTQKPTLHQVENIVVGRLMK